MKILIVEDELLISLTLKKYLESKGHNVQSTGHGKEAIDIISNNTFDKIICDLMLKDITGFEVIEESKRFMDPMDIKKIFILMTAYISNQVYEKASEYGCPVIKKPFQSLEDFLPYL